MSPKYIQLYISHPKLTSHSFTEFVFSAQTFYYELLFCFILHNIFHFCEIK